ncbi:MAG: S1C family serine protease [Oscillospiraceae bacterium]|jgi:serine protease Do|nr:S1C family serine protease [Oscillospiraceae bacterium]
MNHFLKNNQDFYYRTETVSPKKKKKNPRTGIAIAACLLVMLLGIGGGAGGTLLASHLTDTISKDSETLIRPQIPPASGSYVRSTREPAENVYLTTVDTFVINANTTPFAPAELFEIVRDGVVGIEVIDSRRGRFFESEYQLVGSGFIFTTDGYVLTNEHVIENAENIVVLVDDYENPNVIHRYEAEVIGADAKTDLAVLKITRYEEFKALPIGDSSLLRVGTFVSPIGYPLGLEKSMTHGIVSGLNREFDGGGYELSSIQFDAAVNAGNSGGPLFDMYGSVIGIVNKKLVFENYVDNIGLAITINEAVPIINDLILFGAVSSRPMLGITPAELNEFTAAMYGVDVTSGIFVRGINHMAPAFYSDLSVGDIIVEIGGVPVANVADVQGQIKNNRPGDIIELTVIRYNEAGNQRRVTISIELANESELEWE